MSSLYIHIPFCHRKCLYCGFYSIAQKFDIDLYVSCIIREMQHRKDFIPHSIDTIYIGGGTPSLLNVNQIERLVKAIYENFDLSHLQEFTIEINSENADLDYLKSLKSIGINRLSIGVESFDDRILKFLNRSHTSYMAKSAIERAFNADFGNISIDLICNIPSSNFESWKDSLDTATMYDIKHISCYTLMIDDNTMLKKLVDSGKITLVDEEQALKEMDYTMEALDKEGFIHYETSSYCKKGFHSEHNMAYWTFKPYLGLGASAHSYNDTIRCWNENDVFSYVNRVKNDYYNLFPQVEHLNIRDRYNEYVMLSVRIKGGLNKNYVEKNFPTCLSHFQNVINKLIERKLLQENLDLTIDGWHLMDEIILELAL